MKKTHKKKLALHTTTIASLALVPQTKLVEIVGGAATMTPTCHTIVATCHPE